MTTKILFAIGMVLILGAVGVAVWKMQATGDKSCSGSDQTCATSENTSCEQPKTAIQPVDPKNIPIEPLKGPAMAEQPKTAGFKIKIEYCTS